MRICAVLFFVMMCNVAYSADLSPSDVVKKSQDAYKALKTYVGSTTAKQTTDIGGKNHESTASAKVTFKQPGQIHIAGKDMQGGAFTIISDGKKTWHSWVSKDKGAFTEIDNIAMSGMGGVAIGAADRIPSALLEGQQFTGGGSPFIGHKVAGSKLAGHEKIDGHDCYKLVSKSETLGDRTLWIDSKSFLLRQMKSENNEKQLAAMKKSADEAMKRLGKESDKAALAALAMQNVKSMVQVHSFTIDKVDDAVDEKLFADPTKK